MKFSLKPKNKTPEPKQKFDSDIVAIVDLDLIKHSVAGVGETRSIIAKHKKSGKEQTYNTRTEFWGRGKKIGGKLAEYNSILAEKGKEPYTKDDFEITDVQNPEPIENILHSAKMMVLSALESLGTNNAEYFIGEGSGFRVNISTLLEYKANRKDAIKALYLQDVHDYLIRTFKPKVITGIETDDAVTIRAVDDPNAVVVTRDKDAYSQPTKVFNPDRPKMGIVDCDCFGELWIDDSGSISKVRGKGRLHLYQQCISGDAVDNFKFNCFSDKKWGEKSAYKVLVDCKNDKEALEKMIEVAKDLYPEPKVVEGWRGNLFQIDWLYVLREMFLLAKMKYSDYDHEILDDWFIRYGVNYKYEG